MALSKPSPQGAGGTPEDDANPTGGGVARIGAGAAGRRGEAAAVHLDTLTIGGLPIARLSRREMADLMIADVDLARNGALPRPRVITSCNGSLVAAYHSDRQLREHIDQIDLVDADGMAIVFASRIFCKRPLPERAATTDFLLDAAVAAAAHGTRFFLLGARPGVAARAAEHLRYRFPGLQIVGTRNGYFNDSEISAICRQVRDAGTDVLWLGLGSGRQETVALQCRDQLTGLGWVRTCGGLFDHYGGGVSRAPKWMQAAGMEWLYRAAREPMRLGWRYAVTNPVALYHLVTKTHD
jgi:exopolysaccharide biosynthesis WecB/TagA/CpsF family protein